MPRPRPRPLHGLAVATGLLLLAACSSSDAEEREPEAAGGTTSTSASPAPTTPAEPAQLLPDLSTLPASSVQMEGRGDDRVLRFGTTLTNVGTGPLETVPNESTACPEGERAFEQLITADGDGNGVYAPDADTETEAYGGACVLFHEPHDHWHIDGSARYQLQDTEGETLVQTRKVSFCLRDTDRVPGTEAPTGQTYGECAQDKLQGISAGWGDLYDFDLEGQTLQVPDGLEDGTYCLRMAADPFDYFAEEDEDNNASMTPIEIDGNDARSIESQACPAA